MSNPPTRQESRPVSGVMLGIAAALTVAWFTVAAIAIAPQGGNLTASGYGIDDQPAPRQLAQR